MKLYHYVHCPFCVRVRLTAGILGIPYESFVLPYDDEKTPIELMGVKMLPILQDKDFITNESLEIIKYLDKKDILKSRELLATTEFSDLEALLGQLGSNIHSLAMPYWMFTPEFNDQSRDYFQKKKEVKRGPFKELVRKKQEFIDNLRPLLLELENKLIPYYTRESISVYDIVLASHLWGLYIVPEFQFSEKIHNYLQKIKEECQFDYLLDYYRDQN